MPYTARIFATIRDVPVEDWNRVHNAEGDAFSDRRFLEVFERTMGSLVDYAPVVVYDQGGQSVAITCFSICRLDATLLAHKTFRRAVDWIRSVWPHYLKFTIAICGLPVTVPQLKICVLQTADCQEIMRVVDETACAFAVPRRATAILFGDFALEDGVMFDKLLTRGYFRFPSAPMHVLPLRHRSIPEFIAAMRHKYRNQIRRDINRFDDRHVRIETVSDDEKLLEPITPEFYELYLQLLERVELNLVTLPREFFNRLVSLYHREIHLLRAYVDDRPAGFAMGLTLGDTYWYTLVAVDDELNQRFGLYPYFLLNHIGYAMSYGLKEVNIGKTADEFKRRIGSVPQPRRIYVKGRGVFRWPFRWAYRLLFAETPDLLPYHVFRDDMLADGGDQTKAEVLDDAKQIDPK